MAENVRECAALHCEVDVLVGRASGWLERINAKGMPFVGLCQGHVGKSVALKPWAVAILDGSGSRGEEE